MVAFTSGLAVVEFSVSDILAYYTFNCFRNKKMVNYALNTFCLVLGEAVKGFCIIDPYKTKLQVCMCLLFLSWQLCVTVCFHVIKNRVYNSSAVGAGAVQTMSALCLFSLLSAHKLHYFLLLYFLSKVYQLLAFHLWDACFLSPSPWKQPKNKSKTLNVLMKKRECFLKKHFTFTWRIQEDNLKTVESFGNATLFFFSCSHPLPTSYGKLKL